MSRRPPPQSEVPSMDRSDYRRQVEEEFAQEAPQRPSFRELVERSGPPALRAAEASAAAGLSEDEELDAAAALLGDTGVDRELQSEALKVISLDIEARPELIDRLLELLVDADVPTELRDEVLDALQEISFRLPLFPAKRPQFLAALRSIVEVPDARLRRRVIGILAREKDEYVQRRLVEGLEHRSRALVPAAKAIQFLGYDIHAEHFPLLRRIVEQPPNGAAKREAVRLLAADPGSAELLLGILRDQRERPDIRKVAAAALQALNPDSFQTAAREIILDQDEDDQLRAVCISALAMFGEAATLGRDDQLAQTIERLRASSRSRLVRQATADYLAKHGR